MRTADRWVFRVTLGYALFFIYGSLVPLNWRPQPLGLVWQAFLAAPGPAWRDDERVDVAVNFLLTVPLAFGLAHMSSGMRSLGARLASWALVWPAVASLSLGVEFAQHFFPPRDPSWTDVAAQWTGAAAGGAIYALVGRRFGMQLDGLATHHPSHARIRQWLAVYLALMLIFSVMPLDLSLSPVELYRKWRDGRVILVPFSAAWPNTWQLTYDLFTDIALWVPVGLLWRIDGQGRNLRAVVLRGLLAAVLVECAQLLVLSRVSDVTDILLACVGVALGAVTPGVWAGWGAWPKLRQARWLAGGCWLWLVATVAIMWSPFDFDLANATAERAVAAFTRMPFETYFFRGEFGALNEIVRKVLVFLPGGLLLAAWSSRRPARLPATALPAGMVLLALVLEGGQLLVPSKVADATDAVLGIMGALLGWSIARSFQPLAWPAPGAVANEVVPAITLPPQPPMAAAAPLPGAQFLVVGALALLFWLGSRVPGLPYNVAKLMPYGAGGALSSLGLAFAIWWMLAAPLLLLRPQHQLWRWGFPLLALTHALVSFAALRATVPLAMLHKIIGNPVLGWGGPWEDIGRYVALHFAVMLPLYGASLLVRTVQHTAAVADLIFWCFVGLLLFWPLHWVVVACAGTDNLVELMRDGGSLATSAAIGTAVFLLGVAGSALGAVVAPGRRLVLLVMAASALAAAPWLFSAGLEPMLVKYGRAFSALQFIVSAGRDSYAVGTELILRAVLALSVPVLAVAALQAPQWRALAKGDVQRSKRIGTT